MRSWQCCRGITFSVKELTILSQTIRGEAHNVSSTDEKAAVAWTILNRLDKGYGSIEYICTHWYDGYYPTNDADTYMWLAQDVAIRYFLEKLGYTEVGRVIPKEYIFFMGDGKRTNYFCSVYHQSSLAMAQANAWDWSLPSPY